MYPNSDRWKEITPSEFPWEREALAYIRERLPDQEPYRAWSNFEFIADDGSINEVDLLVLTPKGFFLIEIKSRPGVLRGDSSVAPGWAKPPAAWLVGDGRESG
jgi:nuclease-like protein